MTTVSLIVPVYGVEKHIERCLRSVMRQDYQGPIECILVDDCGKDRSVEEAKRVLADYRGKIDFKWFYHSSNKGLSGARNTGLKAATGEYVFFLDSDDEILPYAISSLVSLTEKYPQVDIVYGDWYVSQKYNCLQNKVGLPEYITDKREICRHILEYDVSMTAQNKLIRRQYILENDLFFLENVLHEDLHINCLLANTAQSIAICYIPTYFYYLNPHGITSSYGKKDVTSVFTLVTDLLVNRKLRYRGMSCYYIFDVFMGAYIHSGSLELTERGKSILINFKKEAEATGNWILYLYICFVSTFNPVKLNRLMQGFVLQKIKAVVRRFTYRCV